MTLLVATSAGAADVNQSYATACVGCGPEVR
jgi:hypothetical protein